MLDRMGLRRGDRSSECASAPSSAPPPHRGRERSRRCARRRPRTPCARDRSRPRRPPGSASASAARGSDSERSRANASRSMPTSLRPAFWQASAWRGDEIAVGERQQDPPHGVPVRRHVLAEHDVVEHGVGHGDRQQFLGAEANRVRERLRLVDHRELEHAHTDPVRRDTEPHVLARELVPGEERLDLGRERVGLAHLAADDETRAERRPRELQQLDRAVVRDVRRGDLRRADAKPDHLHRRIGTAQARQAQVALPDALPRPPDLRARGLRQPRCRQLRAGALLPRRALRALLPARQAQLALQQRLLRRPARRAAGSGAGADRASGLGLDRRRPSPAGGKERRRDVRLRGGVRLGTAAPAARSSTAAGTTSGGSDNAGSGLDWLLARPAERRRIGRGRDRPRGLGLDLGRGRGHAAGPRALDGSGGHARGMAGRTGGRRGIGSGQAARAEIGLELASNSAAARSTSWAGNSGLRDDHRPARTRARVTSLLPPGDAAHLRPSELCRSTRCRSTLMPAADRADAAGICIVRFDVHAGALEQLGQLAAARRARQRVGRRDHPARRRDRRAPAPSSACRARVPVCMYE